MKPSLGLCTLPCMRTHIAYPFQPFVFIGEGDMQNANLFASFAVERAKHHCKSKKKKKGREGKQRGREAFQASQPKIREKR
jgi:hypothetical protein